MNKVYKGYELIKEIAEGNIKEYSRFRVIVNNTLIGIIYKEGQTLFWKNQETNEVKVCTLTRCVFELIEDQTIDIDSIEELTERMKFNYDVDKYTDNEINNNFYQITELVNKYIDKQNEILRAVKHLNKEIQSIKKTE